MLKKGDRVYKVCEFEPPDGPPTWIVESREIKSISEKQIALKGYFKESWNVRFNPTALGRVFFETAKLAVADFLRRQQERIPSLNRQIVEVNRAIDWADGWSP